MKEDEIIEDDLVFEDVKNPDLEIINNSLYLIKELLQLESSLYDAFNEDRIKTITQTFKVIKTINEKLIKDYAKK